MIFYLLTSLTRESKFYGTSRSVGELKICVLLGLGVGLRGNNPICVMPSIGIDIFRPFQNYTLLDSLASLTHVSKFKGTSRSDGNFVKR